LDVKGKHIMNIRELITESKERCPQCGMTDCTCAPGTCKCKPIAGWIPNKGFKKQVTAEDHEIQMADSELKSIYQNSRKLLRLIKHYSEQEGLEAWQQSKITKAADYLNSVLQAVSGQQTR
jgi:hypothetical protein